ncbi:MAG: YdiU family protein [Gammaproteobacteria bacterium]|nr:YdiU family protein [Gammaproteobacteria bacterium]
MRTSLAKDPLQALQFENRYTRELPADTTPENFRRQVTGACFSRVQPTPVAAPRLAAYSREVAALLDLDPDVWYQEVWTEILAGNRLLPGMDPHATCYGGHQFGNWAGQLGDGRAINLGDVTNRRGERWTLQLKGAGPTPYSRTADGLAVLRSSVREFLCSEAMHHLGVPTTRALSLVTTGEDVIRDMFYDGRPQAEPGAVVCRVARTFTRFGHFEIFTSRGDYELLRRFSEYTLRTDFPHLDAPSADTYAAWFNEVCRTTAQLMVHWMRVGFVHGVMNTDNMSILGQTIDYGPYGWLENYDPNWTPNTTDAGGRRYRFANQPRIAQWNLLQLANAVYPLIEQAEPLQDALGAYTDAYLHGWREMMAQKLGLDAYRQDTDEALITELLEVLQLTETDMTIFFRQLGEWHLHTEAAEPPDTEQLLRPLMAAYYAPHTLDHDCRSRTVRWLGEYTARCSMDGTPAEQRRARMHQVNPNYVLRNYLAQLAIDDAERGDFGKIHELLDVLRHPYDDQPERQHYAEKRPEWARDRPGCSMLSCSS